jgi:hypothetical protein
MERCANTEALRRYEDEQERQEARYNRALKEFRDSMDDAIDILCGVFKSNATLSSINRNELKAILLEDLGEML